MLGAVVFFVFGYGVSASVPRPITPTPQSEFTRVSPQSVHPRVDVFVASSEPAATASPAPATRPPQSISQPQLKAVSRPTVVAPSGHTRIGVASWYCGAGSRCTSGHPGGFYAAIRKDLLFLRGKTITVRSGSYRVRVIIIDCNCGPHANLIDLYRDAFSQLALPSAGRIPVAISW